MSNSLCISGVHAHWNRGATVRGYDAMRGVSFSAGDHAWVAVVGDNGVGKSTLFHAIGGTIPFMTGSIRVNGIRIHRRDVAARFECGIVHVPQEPAFPATEHWATDAVRLATAWRPALKNDQAIHNLLTYLETFGLIHKGRCTADALELIASIVAVPNVAMLDEVRARISPDDGFEFYTQLRILLGSSIVLFTDHDTELALRVADAVVWLQADAAPVFGTVSEIGHRIRKAAPVEEGPDQDNRQPTVRALRTVCGDESISSQAELAVQCARRLRAERAELLARILEVWPFMGEGRPAETLSGGERVTLAWLLLEASGLGAQFPSALSAHLSNRRLREISRVKTLIQQ